jgi:hypothetical protein
VSLILHRDCTSLAKHIDMSNRHYIVVLNGIVAYCTERERLEEYANIGQQSYVLSQVG